MSILRFSNNASTTLAGAITSVALTASLAPGTGALFPALIAGQIFKGTFVDAATGLQTEIVNVTAIVGDVITMQRAQEGTVAQAWAAGDIFANFWTAGSAEAMLQQAQARPVRSPFVTASGAFVTTNADGTVPLARIAALGASSTTLPDDADVGQVIDFPDIIGNYAQYPLTIAPSAGMNIAGLPGSFVANINRQDPEFRFLGSNTWSVKA